LALVVQTAYETFRYFLMSCWIKVEWSILIVVIPWVRMIL